MAIHKHQTYRRFTQSGLLQFAQIELMYETMTMTQPRATLTAEYTSAIEALRALPTDIAAVPAVRPQESAGVNWLCCARYD